MYTKISAAAVLIKINVVKFMETQLLPHLSKLNSFLKDKMLIGTNRDKITSLGSLPLKNL